MMDKFVRGIKTILDKRNEKFAVAESLTGGMLQETLVRTSGISSCFEGGLTAYSIDAKVKFLGVDKEHAQTVNCVSSRVAKEMSLGVREAFGTHLGISTTGYAESYPEGGVIEPYAFIAVSYRDKLKSEKIEAIDVANHIGRLSFNRQEMRTYVTFRAILLAISLLK